MITKDELVNIKVLVMGLPDRKDDNGDSIKAYIYRRINALIDKAEK